MNLLLISGITLILLVGCYIDVKSPGPNNRLVTYQLDTDDFSIMGPVQAEGEIVSILGLVITGGDGWENLMQQARAQGGDDIMNYHYDLEGYTILLFIYNRARWKATATAIKYKSHVRAGGKANIQPPVETEAKTNP